ncbi:hypothetical protein A3L12_01920 [Thermococcus sp. P6]|uniref:MvaI/BcnI family restriction endonuclease n=1 Tax=Thermococcus sp. P6 TaxID=122420 RepID=UPI000B59E3CC|nr:MvaI/BcnI family restriction endonuclease [Thermococcus sp. P6]ASJ10138.1 hypothetical protein A3L12_01920 [Thermococcus sp. P6]
MDLAEFVRKIRELKARGYIKARRRGDTGIGYTLEQEIGLTENNVSKPDLGDIELKAHRRNSSSRITLFTLDRNAWKINQRNLILKYGSIDSKGRRSLYCTVSNKPNPQGFYTVCIADKFCLFHTDGELIAEWRVEDLINAFSKKMPNLILVVADRKLDSNGREEFWYNEAYYLEGVDRDKFIEFLQSGVITVDLRMHLRENNTVRNHGTAFRIEEKYLHELFSSRINLLESNLEKTEKTVESNNRAKIRQKRLTDF